MVTKAGRRPEVDGYTWDQIRRSNGKVISWGVEPLVRAYSPPSPPSRSYSPPSPPSPPSPWGCFAGDGRVAVGPRGEATRRVDELRPGNAVWAPNLQREVTIVATSRSFVSLTCTVNGLRISRKHPVNLSAGCDESAWVEAQNLGAVEKLAEPLAVHNFVLSSGGTMAVNGMSVMTLGPDTPSDHEYYGTAACVDDLKALPSWPACEW